MKGLLGLCILLLLAGPLAAAPDLGQFRDIDGIRIYRDHLRQDTWYLTPATPQLAERDDHSPALGFDLFRYYGRQATGDQQEFWAHGILTLTVERQRPAQQLSAIRKVLQTAGVKRPKLRSMPITGADIRLLYAGQKQQWQQGSRWSGGTIVLPLDADIAQLLWKAAELGQLQVSLVVEERLAGVRLAKDSAETWQKTELASGWTLPVDLDRQHYPDLFRRTDLSGRMARGYTGLDVFCFDFLEQLVPGLYAKLVEVAIPTDGRDLVETITFYESGDYRARIDFELARDFAQPYRVRITEVFTDGRRETGPWQQKQGDSLLDITAYRNPSEHDSNDTAAVSRETEFNNREDLNDGI